MKKLSLFLAMLIAFSFATPALAVLGYNDGALAVIYEAYDAIDKKDWDRYYNQFASHEQEDLRMLLDSKQMQDEKIGLFNVKSVRVLDAIEYDLNNKEVYNLFLQYPYMTNYLLQYGGNIRIFLISVDMDVYREDEFARNGFDVRVEFITKENGSWKCFASSLPPQGEVIELAYPESRSQNISKVLELKDLSFKHSIVANMSGDILLYKANTFKYFDNFNLIEKATYSSSLFTDIDENAWYGANAEGSVKEAFELKIVAGLGNRIFDPMGTLTVGQAIKMAAVVHNIYYGGNGTFIQGSPWYKVYVDYAIEKGIVTEGLFSDYNRAITRAEMARVFASVLPQEVLPSINNIDHLQDVTTSTPYSDSIFTLYSTGVLFGRSTDGTFNPNDNITRAEATALITRLAVPTMRKFIFETAD